MAKEPLEPLTILVDTREQTPLTPWFSNAVAVEVVGLPTGDYSAKHCTELVTIERKSAADFVACCTFERERFLDQMQRLSKYQVKALVIEANWRDFARGAYRSHANPKSITGTLLKLITDFGIPVMLAESPQYAAEIVERILGRVLKQSMGKAA